MQELKIVIIGYGSRGYLFSEMIKSSSYLCKVVGVADTNSNRRAQAKAVSNLEDDMIFESAEVLLSQPKFADIAIITTMDREHYGPVISAMKKGYHILLEKPMAVTLEECEEIERVQQETGVIAAVCHSLRYNKVYETAKKMIDEGKIGEIVSIDQMEGVGDVHFTSSYVRGNWGKTDESSFMLIAKASHDIDLMSYFVNRKCEKVTSFGGLSYFRKENKPENTPEYCIDGCPKQMTCQYCSTKIYMQNTAWRYVFDLKDDTSVENYLRTTDYGKCVWGCKNDAADHQVVNFEYEGGITGTLTVIAFHPGDRHTRIFGTKGIIECGYYQRNVDLYEFDTCNRTAVKVSEPFNGSHGGGDALVLENLCTAVRTGNDEMILTNIQQSLASHRIVFAAEKARIENRIVEL
ncbi:MAG: Gfo/Idh/MocA family protein [Saccharofermentanales bacterium]